jgi:chromosome segregation protein
MRAFLVPPDGAARSGERAVTVRVDAGAIELAPQDDEGSRATTTTTRLPVAAFTLASRRSRARRGGADAVDVRVALAPGRRGVLRLRCAEGEAGARRLVDALRGAAAAGGAAASLGGRRSDDDGADEPSDALGVVEAYARHVSELEAELERRGRDLEALHRRAAAAAEEAAAAAAAREGEARRRAARRDAAAQAEGNDKSTPATAAEAAAAAATATATAAALVAAAADEARRAQAQASEARREADALRAALRACEARAADLRRREQQAWREAEARGREADEERARACRWQGARGGAAVAC